MISFKEKVLAEKAKHPEYNIRYLAFVVDLGGEAFKGNVINRNAAFMAWIGERKAQYVKMRGHMVVHNYCGGASIIDQADFTNFIVGGTWR